MPELCFPFLAMRVHFMPEMYKGEQVRELMEECYEEAVRIECSIDTDAVERVFNSRVSVVAKHAFALMR